MALQGKLLEKNVKFLWLFKLEQKLKTGSYAGRI